MGDGTQTNRSEPYQVSDGSWQHIAAGAEATCGIQNNGTLHCWGQWHLTRNASTPTLINADDDWVSVAAGGAYSQNSFCAIKEDASLWCFGDNYQGILGLGEAYQLSYSPQLSELDKALAVSIGATTHAL